MNHSITPPTPVEYLQIEITDGIDTSALLMPPIQAYHPRIASQLNFCQLQYYRLYIFPYKQAN